MNPKEDSGKQILNMLSFLFVLLPIPSFKMRVLTPTKESNVVSSCRPALPMFLLMASLLLKGLGAAATAGHGGSPECASCRLPPMEKDTEERMVIEIAKRQILDKLHLKERPNITQTVPRAALLTALRKLYSGRVRQDGTLELDNNMPTTDQGYEIVSFAGTFGTHCFWLSFQVLLINDTFQ